MTRAEYRAIADAVSDYGAAAFTAGAARTLGEYQEARTEQRARYELFLDALGEHFNPSPATEATSEGVREKAGGSQGDREILDIASERWGQR